MNKIRNEKLATIVVLCFTFIFQATSYATAATYAEMQHAANVSVNNNIQSAISDPTYPKYHLRAPSGWINDPCGLFYFNSSFHVFCQSNPWGSQWGDMTWSHIVGIPSKKWNYKWFYPVDKNGIVKTSAIMPSLNSNAPDKDGIFTGCIDLLPYKVKQKDGKDTVTYYPTAIYSGVWGTDESKQEVICFARALQADKVNNNGKLIDPFLTEWTKYSSTSKNNPNSNPDIIIAQPKNLNLVSFRDPYLFRLPNDPNYYMLISTGIKDKNGPRGIILLYKNNGQDLTKNWERANKENNFFFSNKTAVKDPVTRGGDFECATVFRLTDHIGTTNDTPYILVFGQDGNPAKPYGKAIYYVLGKIKKSKNEIKFVPIKSFKKPDGDTIMKPLDLNPDFIFYASNVMPVDNEQRKYLFGWLNIGSQANDGKQYCWAGALSSPRFLFVYKEKGKWKLGQEPWLVNALREKPVFNSIITFSENNKEITLNNVEGRYLNISAIFNAKDILSSKFGIKVACAENKNTDICVNKGKLCVAGNAPIELNLPDSSSKVRLNIYLDGSIMEIFISKYLHKAPVSYKVYSSPLPNNGSLKNNEVKVYGNKGMTATITVYPMNTCWEKTAVLR